MVDTLTPFISHILPLPSFGMTVTASCTRAGNSQLRLET